MDLFDQWFWIPSNQLHMRSSDVVFHESLPQKSKGSFCPAHLINLRPIKTVLHDPTAQQKLFMCNNSQTLWPRLTQLMWWIHSNDVFVSTEPPWWITDCDLCPTDSADRTWGNIQRVRKTTRKWTRVYEEEGGASNIRLLFPVYWKNFRNFQLHISKCMKGRNRGWDRLCVDWRRSLLESNRWRRNPRGSEPQLWFVQQLDL